MDALFKGLKVVDAGTWIAGPVSSTILADYGADVTKVEMPGDGDAYRRLAHAVGTPNADINYAWAQDARTSARSPSTSRPMRARRSSGNSSRSATST